MNIYLPDSRVTDESNMHAITFIYSIQGVQASNQINLAVEMKPTNAILLNE